MEKIKSFKTFITEKAECETGSSEKVRKSKDRKSPTDSATCHDVGTEMEGNNGKMWVVKADKNGTHRWVEIKEEDED